MKKISAILLALVMMLSMVAMAATITVTPPTGDGTEAGITYKAYKVFDAVINGENVAYTINSVLGKDADGNDIVNPFYTVVDANTNITLEQLNDTTIYMVTGNTLGANDSDAVKALAAALKAVATDDVLTKTFSDKAGATEIDEGYYLITSTVGDALILDTTQTNSFTTKNQYPTIDKTVEKTTANLGDTVTYTITVTVPANANGTIVVHDTMTGLKYVDLAEGTTAGVTANTTSTCEKGCSVEFTINAAANKGTTVTIKYTAIVTANTANNEAYLVDGSYTSNPDTTGNEVKAYDFDVFKYTKGEGNEKVGLGGAGFVLKNAAGEYYKYTAPVAATETSEAVDAKVEWVANINDATEHKTTNDDTTITFVGLAEGTYTLVEKTVPAGYNAAQNTTVILKDGKVYLDEVNTDNEVDKVEVLNSTGSELPSTGGMGTTLFYVVGGLMMAAAVVLLVSKKKVNA